MATIFPPPPKLDLPLSKGADLDVTFIYMPLVDGVPTEADWPVGSTVTAVIDAKGQAVEAVAVITGSHARVHVDHQIVDPIPAYTLWRLVHTLPAEPDDVDDVLVNGTVVRSDGAQ